MHSKDLPMNYSALQEIYQIIDEPDYVIGGDPDENLTAIFKNFAEQLNPKDNRDNIRYCQIDAWDVTSQLVDNVITELGFE